ncbi:branched-chain amino acid ABC transporter permease [Bradyrhizobium sp. CIR3A]|uniref:branched-chain amino acid ABC transporter permease n=1 Tax=Bradyrhizobium sp. CIR3A TaxID=2663838 RepID=UPI001606A0B5|nr:branched-chain amino acid ABC transporter permease [Bradyrhizobium sp. CIR3A]MBB4261358.1 branched-chain amino acid transport system permease protein [Bradyrhizobium sp. CIR3A]
MTEILAIAPFFSVSLLLALSCFLLLRAGEISFGQQAFFAVGAYGGGCITALFEWPLIGALVIASLVGAFGALMVSPMLVRLGGFRFTLATLVLGEWVQEVLTKVRLVRTVNGRDVGPDGPLGFSGIDYFTRQSWSLYDQALLNLCFAMVATAALVLALRGSGGRHLAAVAQDPGLASSIGINPLRVRRLAIVASGALAGLGGGLFAHDSSFIDPTNFSLMSGVHAVAYTLLGGVGSVAGPVIGTAVDIILLEGLRITGSYRMVAFGCLLVLGLILLPGGFVGRRPTRGRYG